MITRLKIALVVLCSATGLLFAPALTSLAASPNPLDQACNTNAETKKSPLCQQAQTQGTTNPVSGPGGVINKAANIIALVVGIGAVIMILIGGFEFITAGGTGFKAAPGAGPTKAAKARARISSALIGLVVVALAWAIIRIITDRVIQ